MIRHLLPDGLTAATYDHFASSYDAALMEVAGRTYLRHYEISCTPGVMARRDHDELLEAANLLIGAATAVVDAYPTDDRVQRYFDLPADLHELALDAGAKPFRVHTARPDFLIDATMRPRFCEINCRFPANGILNSLQMSRAACDLYRTPAPFDLTPEMVLGDDDGGLLALVQESEIGDEIWDLVAGRPLVTTHPGGLRTHAGRFHVGGHEVSRVIVELDRSELLHFAPEVRAALVRDEALLNDVRGPLLLHDKRLLAVLCDERVMADLIDGAQYARLQPYLIPSHRADDPSIRGSVLADPSRWILKPASGGRGRGTLVGDVAARSDWRRAIDGGRGYVAQHFVEQPKFDLVSGVEDGALRRVAMTVVGCVPVLHGSALGAGLLRASNELLVNVSDGRAIMLACNLEP